MQTRRFVLGSLVAALMLGMGAFPAKALFGVPTPPAPTPAGVQTLVLSVVPATPVITPPQVNPANPQLPNLPYVAPPPGLNPALSALSPTTVLTCQASYLAPLVGIVVLTAVFDALGVDPPVQPSFLNPLFSPITSACVLAPFPTVTSCGPDGTVTEQLGNLPALPAAGPAPTVDPFSLLPAPFASLVTVLASIEGDVGHYVYSDTWAPKVSDRVADELTCS